MRDVLETRLVVLGVLPGNQNTLEVIRYFSTAPLLQSEISKRLVRILIVLAEACNATRDTWVHMSLEQIKERLAVRFDKKYSTGDMSAFLGDAVNRGYVHHVDHEDYGSIYALLPEGDLLAATAIAHNHTLAHPSTSPNCATGIVH